MPVYAQTSVPGGSNLYTVLNGGNYNLHLDGDNGIFNVNNAAKTSITIDGNGKTIDLQGDDRLFVGNIATASPFTLSLTDAVITKSTLPTARSAVFFISVANVTGNLNLEGTTFKDIRPSNNTGVGNYGPIISVRSANSTWHVEGELQALHSVVIKAMQTSPARLVLIMAAFTLAAKPFLIQTGQAITEGQFLFMEKAVLLSLLGEKQVL